MRTAKQIENKIIEIKNQFLEEDVSSPISLASIRRQIDTLLWVLGKKEWKTQFAKNHGARIK